MGWSVFKKTSGRFGPSPGSSNFPSLGSFQRRSCGVFNGKSSGTYRQTSFPFGKSLTPETAFRPCIDCWRMRCKDKNTFTSLLGGRGCESLWLFKHTLTFLFACFTGDNISNRCGSFPVFLLQVPIRPSVLLSPFHIRGKCRLENTVLHSCHPAWTLVWKGQGSSSERLF